MEGGHVTLLAQGGAAGREQALVDCAVGAVAEAAVLGRRRVLPQERSALFLVALLAAVIDGGLVQAGVPEAAMGIVAVAAGGLALGYGMAGGQQQFRLYPRVASEAGLLRPGGQCRVLLPVAVVATVAGHAFALVFTTGPVQGAAAAVAAETAAGSCLRR